MGDYRLVLPTGPSSDPVEMDTQNVISSLIVAGINLDEGTAELRKGDKRIATLRKCGSEQAPFWMVNPAA
jgi:hypothetical protein